MSEAHRQLSHAPSSDVALAGTSSRSKTADCRTCACYCACTCFPNHFRRSQADAAECSSREGRSCYPHTGSTPPGTTLSREGQLLLSEITDAGGRGDWLNVRKLYGKYGGSETQIFNAVMRIAINCTQYKEGLAVYERACNMNIAKASPTFTAAMKLHARLNKPEAVERIWAEALSTCPLDEVLAGARIDAAAAVGDVEAAPVLEQLNRTSGTTPTWHTSPLPSARAGRLRAEDTTLRSFCFSTCWNWACGPILPFTPALLAPMPLHLCRIFFLRTIS